MGAMVELLFSYTKRIAYKGRVFKTAKAAKRVGFFAASGTSTKRRGGKEAGCKGASKDGKLPYAEKATPSEVGH